MAEYTGGGLLEGLRKMAAGLLPFSSDPGNIVQKILTAIISLLGILAVIAIVIAGLILLVQGYDEGKRQQAFRALVNVFIGLILVIMASAIVHAIIGLVD